MKKYFLFFLIFPLFCLLSNTLFANEFTIEKINTFAFAQNFCSNVSMEIDPPYLYALTTCALEIYEIQSNAQLQKISELPIMKLWKFVKRDNYLYIGSNVGSQFDPSPLFIYQVDVSDKYNPSITQILEFDNLSGAIFPVIVGDYFIAETFWGTDYIYTIPELELYGTIEDSNIYLSQIKENICISPVGWSVFDIYDTADLLNIQYLNTIDMSPYHQGYNPTSFKVINDTILIASGQSAISFWNIVDISQWEYISHYEPDEYLVPYSNIILYNNNLILLRFDGLELVDISELTNPQSIDFISSYINKYSIINDNENIYIGTDKDGIGIYYIANNELHFLESYFEYPNFYSAHLYSNHLFLQTTNYGLYVFDITDPYQPIELTTCLNNAPLKSLVGHDSLIVVYDYDEISIKIYNISEPANPILRNTIDDLTFLDWWCSIIRFDDSEPQAMYLFNGEDGNLRKYDISEPGSAPLFFTYNEISQECSFFVKDGYGYALSKETHPQHLYIIGGLNINNPTIINTIEFFSQYTYSPYIDRCGDYLCLRYSADYYETKLYSLDDPENPQLACTLEVPSTNSWPNVYDNLLFTKTHNLSFVYDLNECNGDTLHYIDYFDGLFMMYRFDFYDIGDVHYLFVTEQSSVGVYEFSYSYGVDDEPVQNSTILTCSPNPFSTSTTISFAGKINPHESSQIKIYNVKGQLVREFGLRISEFGFSVIWDGKNEQGREVKNGVYFCKLDTKQGGFLRKIIFLK